MLKEMVGSFAEITRAVWYMGPLFYLTHIYPLLKFTMI